MTVTQPTLSTDKPKFELWKSQSFFLFLVIVVISVVAGLINPRFFTVANLLAIFQQIAVLGIVTMSMVFMLMSGLLDLSVGPMIGLAAVIVCKLTILGHSLWLALAAGVAACLAAGLVNGVIVAKTRCVPLIATLGLGYVYNGIAMVISGGLTITLKAEFNFLGREKILGIPVSMIVLMATVVFTWFVLKHTAYGRRITAIGGNEEAAFLAGIGTTNYKIVNYVLSSALCALAGLVLVSRLGSVVAQAGDEYTLRSLAAAVVGGVTFEGGRGTVVGAFLGVILLGIIANAMNILRVSSYWQTAVLGVVIVVAVVVSSLGKRGK